MTRTSLKLVSGGVDLDTPTALPTSCPELPINARFGDAAWSDYAAARATWEATTDGRAWRDAEDARIAARDARERERSLRERRADRLDVAQVELIDSVHEQVVSGTLGQTAPLVEVLRWLGDASAKPWLVLAGPTGCGKSVAAAAAVARCGGVWIAAPQLQRIFLASFGEPAEQQEKVRTAKLLVIDDLGCEPDAERMKVTLIELLDARKSALRHRTIVTTNLVKLTERYANERIVSRLHEQAHMFRDAGADLRRQS